MAGFDSPQESGAAGTGPDRDGVEPARRWRGALGRTINLLGAVASLVLIAGVGIWGYRLVMRDVSGVPVVRAAQGPTRLQPEDPGGRPADHLGLAVNTVAAEGSAAPAPDQLVLAPSPVDLAEEDAPMPQLAAAETPDAPQPPDAPAAEAGDAGEAVAAFEAGAVDDLIRQLLAGEQLPDAPDAAADGAVQGATRVAALGTESLPGAEPAVLAGPGPSFSPRPRLRPDPSERVPVALAALEPQTQLDVDPASLATGTKLAQLGAYESPEMAVAEWDRLNLNFADYLADKQRVIQKASSGGKEFYRLRAMGFDDLNDARRFCSAFVAEGADCIPVVVR